jgi:tryptophan synthase alpha chain
MADAEAAAASGVERIAGAFAAARREGRAALMPYVMGGFPDHEASLGIARAYVEAGADLIELGVPFSDPLADGPVIHSAGTHALERGATFGSVLEICRAVASSVPVVPMVYANMLLAMGPEAVADALRGAGACGAIVPDLPPEEGGEIAAALTRAGLALIPLVAPTTPPARLAEIGGAASGFIYVVSDTRVTGERDDVPAGLGELVDSVRAATSVPVAVGFGVGTPEQAGAVGALADGVIVGTRLVREAGEAAGEADAVAAVGSFLRAARDAMS